MSGMRFVGFLTIVLGSWALMHAFVFWRVSSVPWVASHIPRRVMMLVAFVLWASYVLARVLDAKGLQAVGWPIEYLAANWIGALFLMFAALVATDVITVGGWILRDKVATIRGWVLLGALILAGVALIQGLRSPVVTDYEVRLRGLPARHDGLVLVQVSDLHIGNLLGGRWLNGVIRKVNELKPDMIAVVGDVVDGNVGRVEPLVPILSRFSAPLGTWAVTGNHEFYAGVERSVRVLRAAGLKVLRDQSEEVVPGLVMAGIDDLTAREQLNDKRDVMATAINSHAAGGVIMLSHTPWQAASAAAAGAGLMLSGHTHNGQIWPFNYLVKTRYPLVAGRYEVDGMTSIVCRGTGTWGPRMRLWLPGEIVRITLRSAQ